MIAARRPSRGRALRRGPARLAITFTPMIDIVFLLLLYFLLVAQFKSREELLPLNIAPEPAGQRAEDPFALPEEPVVVTVRSLGDSADDLAFHIEALDLPDGATIDELSESLAAARGDSLAADQLFIIRPERTARWEHTLIVVNAVKRAGYDRLLLVDPPS